MAGNLWRTTDICDTYGSLAGPNGGGMNLFFSLSSCYGNPITYFNPLHLSSLSVSVLCWSLLSCCFSIVFSLSSSSLF